MENIYDLCNYRTKKALAEEITIRGFQVLGASSVQNENSAIYELLVKKILNKKSALIISDKTQDEFVKDLLLYITKNNILDDAVKLYNLLYKTPIYIMNSQNVTEIWLNTKNLISHRKIDYIILDDYNKFKGESNKLELLSTEFNIAIIAFLEGKVL